MERYVINDFASLTLVVVRYVNRQFRAKQIAIAGDVTDDLMGTALSALDLLSTGRGRKYDPDGELENADFLIIDADDIFGQALINLIDEGASLEQLTEEDNWYKNLYCYAVVLQLHRGGEVILIRKASPVQLATKGLITRFSGNQLDKLESPVFAFDDFFDVAIVDNTMYAFEQKRFENLFKKSDLVTAHISGWAHQAFEQFPISDEAREQFCQRAASNWFTLRKLRSIVQKGYARNAKVEDLRSVAASTGLDVDVVFDGDQLNLTPDTEKDILSLLNDDRWVGLLSKQTFVAGRKESIGKSR